MMNSEIFDSELLGILNNFNGITLDKNMIKEKYNLENIDYYIVTKNSHIFIKYKWIDKSISMNKIDNFIEDCNKINSNSLKIVINEFKIDLSNNNIKLISEKSVYQTLRKIDDAIQQYIAVVYYSNYNCVTLDYIK